MPGFLVAEGDKAMTHAACSHEYNITISLSYNIFPIIYMILENFELLRLYIYY